MPFGFAKETKKIDVSELSGIKKAAILFIAMRHETASRVLKLMPAEVVEEITREIAATRTIDPNLRQAVVAEFYNLALARQYADAGGLSYARSLLQEALSPEEAKRVIATIEHQVYQQPFSFLQKTETENLLTFLQEEHPQTIALVLSHLPSAKASEILVGLPPEKQVEVIARVANMDQTSPDVIKEVERGLENRLSGVVSERFQRVGGINAVAEMLNLAGRAAERSIFEGLEQHHPELVDEIRRLMFVFEDIIRINDRGIQSILKEVDNEQLSLALKTASEDLKKKIFGNMSERAAALIQEEMQFMGPVRVSDVEAAQQKIVDIVRRLEDAGEIIISGKGGDKDMIV
ncbi:MAG: Flagellar motor switch protein FliG [Phycisphaerae bacterium]|nr:Flagellar motor switch protein FliG [Phycisphaerae bacterium]